MTETAAKERDHEIAPNEVQVTPGRFVRLSNRIAAIEGSVAGALIAGVFLLLVVNVVTRFLTVPLFWTDELAIYFMIWSAFIGASVGLARSAHIAVTLLPDAIGPHGRKWIAVGVDLILLAFFASLAAVLWLWFEPLKLLLSPSLNAFSQESFNFIYEEPTTTIGLRKVWFWLVLPVFCLTSLVHVSANLARSVAGLRGAAK